MGPIRVLRLNSQCLNALDVLHVLSSLRLHLPYSTLLGESADNLKQDLKFFRLLTVETRQSCAS